MKIVLITLERFCEFGEKEEYVSFNDWEGYLEQMKKTQVWATELEAEVLAIVLNRPIVLMKEGNKPRIYTILMPKMIRFFFIH